MTDAEKLAYLIEKIRVAALGPGIERWISIFLDSLQPETFTPKPGAHHAKTHSC